MKRKLTGLSRHYEAALRQNLKQGPQASLRATRELGRTAMTLGLGTLDLAKIHEAALAALEAASSRDGIIKRAEIFFAEAITPTEKTHDAALKTGVHLTQLYKTLDRRTVELAASNQSLKRKIVQRKGVEQALKKSTGHNVRSLKESRLLQKRLQRLAHQVLKAQEDERSKISHALHDEIAQTLLGINVRLLTLKQKTTASPRDFKKEIASTQRLVESSGRTIERFTREFGEQHDR